MGLNTYEIEERIGDNVEMVLKIYIYSRSSKNIIRVLNDNVNFLFEKEKESCQRVYKHKKTP